jgi:hypothetical protein
MPGSDPFGDFQSPAGYGIQLLSHGRREYCWQNPSLPRNASKRQPDRTMGSKSRRSSTIDGEYEWDEPEQDLKKKSRSKLPPEDKLVVSSQCCPAIVLPCTHTFLQKRRDQNRVSQRAFRQRKEKHTKELEAKVEELENLLESASHENSVASSQMSRMEEELCYYRRLLFNGGNGTGQGLGYSSPSSETSANSSYTANYTSTSTYPTTYSPIPATAAPTLSSYAVNSPASNASSSANSSPSLSNIPDDFGSGNGADGIWGYEVPQTPGYLQFNTSGTGHNWQGREDTW